MTIEKCKKCPMCLPEGEAAKTGYCTIYREEIEKIKECDKESE